MSAILERETEELAIEKPFRWTREAFVQASNAGIFGEGRFELLQGEIFEKMTMGSPHISALYLVRVALEPIFEPQNAVFVQVPFAFNENDLPEPDVAVLDCAFDARPQLPATSALLVVEIADTTLWRDRNRKAPLYAQAQIPEYWILNLNDRILEVYRQPASLSGEPFGWGYRQITRLSEGDSISPLSLPENPIAIASLLPPISE